MFLGRDHDKEHLITAFGRRKGRALNRPAEFQGLHVPHGTRNAVQFSRLNLDYPQKHVDRIRHAELLVCHNHPGNFVSDLLSAVIDWSPLPSNTDRETMYEFKHNAIARWLASGNFQNMRFYLIEEGRLREILLPATGRIAKILRTAVSSGGQPQNSVGFL